MSDKIINLHEKKRQPWWFVQVILPAQGRPKGDPGWRPSMVFFSADESVKGMAVFTSWAAAEEFKAAIPTKLQTEIIELGSAMPIKTWYQVALGCVGNHKALLHTPVYVDPIDSYGKDHRPAFATLERWFLRHWQNEVPWDFDVDEMVAYGGCTICVMRHAQTGLFVAVTMKGAYETRESIANAIEDAYGTTEWRYYTRTNGSNRKEDAIVQAQRFVDHIQMRE